MSELNAFRIIQGDTGGYGTPSYKCDTDGNRIEEWSDACEVYDKYEVDAAFAEIKAENRRLKRALWLARAERAKERKYKYETWERNEMKKFNWDGDLIAIVSMKARMWRRVEIKCIKKAEEYKWV